MATVGGMSEQAVLAVPAPQAIRDELQRLVLADLLGPLGGPAEEFTGEDPLERYLLGRLAPHGVAVEPDTQDELGDAEMPDIVEGEREASAPAVPSLAPSAIGFTACVAGAAPALLVVAKWAR